jgi:hypothetical protein
MNMNNNICQVKQDILVTLDTRNCTSIYNGDKFSDVEWDLSDVIKKPNKGVEFSVSVVNASIPIGQYNVDAVDNTGLSITITTAGGSPYTFGMSPAHLTITSLLSTIRGNLPAPYSIGYVDYRNRFYIINESGAAFTFKVGTGLAEPLGFEPNKIYSSEVGGSIIAPYCVNMSGLRKVNIHLDNLNTKNISSFTKSSSTIIASIPIDVNSMGVVSYNLSSDYEIPVPISSIDYINLLLKDDMGNFIQNNGIHWSVTLKFSYYIEQEFSTETLHEKINRQKITIVQPKPMITEIPKIFSSRKDLETQDKKL